MDDEVSYDMKPRSRKDAGEMEDDGGAWMNDREGPKMAEFLFWLTEPAAEAPLKNVVMVSSSDTGGPEKNILRLVSKQFKDDAEEGTTSIAWKGPGKSGGEECKPISLMSILVNPMMDEDGRFKSRFPNLKSIDCRGLDTLMDLNGCPSGLEVLNCFNCKLIKTLAPLATCTNLRKLSLSRIVKVASLQPLVASVHLEWLSIISTSVSDLRPLSACANLKVLWMGGSQVSDLSPLSGLGHLRFLDLASTAVVNLSPLCYFPCLETLLCNNTKISDLTPLSKCSELKVLNIKDTKVKSLTPLLQCKQLRHLNHDNLKDQTKEQTEGYIRFLKEVFPELKSTELSFADWWATVPSDLKKYCVNW